MLNVNGAKSPNDVQRLEFRVIFDSLKFGTKDGLARCASAFSVLRSKRLLIAVLLPDVGFENPVTLMWRLTFR